MVAKSINATKAVAGRVFSFLVPERTFYDREDGNTRMLRLNISTPDHLSKCWFTFNSTLQTLKGLPFTALVAKKQNAIVSFQLTATDTCGLSVADNFSLILTKPDRHCFEMTIAFKTQKLYDCEWVAVNEFVNQVAMYYRFDVNKDIAVIDYARSKKFRDRLSVKLSFSQGIVKCDQCDSTEIANVTYRVLNRNNFTVNREFNEFLSPTFAAINVLTTGVDTCAAYVLPLVQGDKTSIPILAWLLPVLIFSAALALTCLLALCRYCGCCSCCVCIFPVDEDEELFMRKECPPRRHRTYREFIGSDFDQNYPSIRKNRAGQLPDDTSVESADDIIGSGSDDGIIPPAPLPRKEKPRGDTDMGHGGSVGVTTIVYATPPVGKESTELSVFSNTGGMNETGGDGVNVVYHNLAETAFHGCDDEGYARTHGSFESLILRRGNSGAQQNGGSGLAGAIKAHGSANRGFRDSVVLEVGNECTGTAEGAMPSTIANSISMTSQSKRYPEDDTMRSTASCNFNGNLHEPPFLLDEGSGVFNGAFEGDDEDLIQSSDTAKEMQLVLGGINHGENHAANARLSLEGDISCIKGEKNASLASNRTGAKQATNHMQSNVSGRALMHGGENSTDDADSTTTTAVTAKRRNAVKVNKRVHTRMPGIDNPGLLVENEETNQSRSWTTFDVSKQKLHGDDSIEMNGDSGNRTTSNDEKERSNQKSTKNVSLKAFKEQDNKEGGIGTCHVQSDTCHLHMSSCTHNEVNQEDRSVCGLMEGQNARDHAKMCQKCAEESCKTKHTNQVCVACNPHVPCDTNAEFTCLVGHSKHCLAAGHVSCSGLVQMKAKGQSGNDECSHVTNTANRDIIEPFNESSCSNHMLSSIATRNQTHFKCLADIKYLHQPGPDFRGKCNVCINAKSDVTPETDDQKNKDAGMVNRSSLIGSLGQGNEPIGTMKAHLLGSADHGSLAIKTANMVSSYQL